MKVSSTALSQPLRVALPFWLCAIWCAPVAGTLLLRRQLPTADGPLQHIELNIQKLHQEADAAVAQQATLLTAVAQRKQKEATDAIEKEIPLATAADTQELGQDVAANDKELNAALQRSRDEAKEGLEVLKEKTAKAVNMSTLRTVRDVEKQVEEGAVKISEHSTQLQAEAQALAKEAVGAAKFGMEASDNSKLWVKELPSKEAEASLEVALKSEAQSKQLRHEYEDVKRMAKLAGNMALNTIALAEEAAKEVDKAKTEATLTVEQAAQNALLLNTIRDQTKTATDTSIYVIDRLQQ